MSPAELWVEFEAAEARQQDMLERLTYLAWQIDRIRVMRQNQKRLPALRELLPRRPSLAQTPAQMEKTLHMLSAQYGIPLRKH